MRYHFLHPNGDAHMGAPLAPEEEWPLFYSSTNAWILQGYYRLRGKLEGNVTISSQPDPEAINISTSEYWRRVLKHQRLEQVFIVNCLSDKPDYVGADLRVVQNATQVRGTRDCYVPVWPQPCLQPASDAQQRDKTKLHIGFFGRPRYGLAGAKQLMRAVEQLGFEYTERTPDQWHDYTGIDIAVGIRGFGHWRYDHKPPSKLVNAWHAGVPFIGGSDSAYTQVGEPGHDYLRVTTSDALLAALKRLRCPEERQRLVAAGQHQARRFTHEAIAARWCAILEHAARPAFEDWLAAGRPRLRRHSKARLRLQVLGTRLGRRVGWF